MVCAGCALTNGELSGVTLTDEHTEYVDKSWRAIPRIIPVLNFHMPKDFVPLYLPSVFDPMWGEDVTRRCKSAKVTLCLDCIVNSCLHSPSLKQTAHQYH